jgi:hypothetical protein
MYLAFGPLDDLPRDCLGHHLFGNLHGVAYGGAGVQETLASFVFATFNVNNMLITRKVSATAAINGTCDFNTGVTLLLVFRFCFFSSALFGTEACPIFLLLFVTTCAFHACCIHSPNPRLLLASYICVAGGGWICAALPRRFADCL